MDREEIFEIKSLSEFIEIILGTIPQDNLTTVYRGHGSHEFPLQPSIFRNPSIKKENEHIILRETAATHPDDFQRDITTLELLVRVQRYSLPTRLLDVTLNPLVALFFACKRETKRIFLKQPSHSRVRATRRMDGQVIMFHVPTEHIRYFDSDTVSCLSNLARLPWDLKRQLNTSLNTENFNETLPAKRLIHLIRQEKIGFTPEINPEDLDKVILVKPKQNNKSKP